MLDADTLSTKPPRPAFGRWLLLQERATMAPSDVKDLAAAAGRDPRFPKDGDPDQAGAYLRRAGADPDSLEALARAELDWLCY